MFLGYTVLRLFVFTICATCNVISPGNMFCTFTLVLSAVCVQCPAWQLFCSRLFSSFPGVLLRYCLSDCEMVPVAPIIIGITFAFTLHMRWIYVIIIIIIIIVVVIVIVINSIIIIVIFFLIFLFLSPLSHSKQAQLRADTWKYSRRKRNGRNSRMANARGWTVKVKFSLE